MLQWERHEQTVTESVEVGINYLKFDDVIICFSASQPATSSSRSASQRHSLSPLPDLAHISQADQRQISARKCSNITPNCGHGAARWFLGGLVPQRSSRALIDRVARTVVQSANSARSCVQGCRIDGR